MPSPRNRTALQHDSSGLQSSTQRTIGLRESLPLPRNRTSLQHDSSLHPEAPDRQDQSDTDVHDSTMSQDYHLDGESDDSRESWEKDITRWPPGQRPRLEHHPYDMWNNRPTARFGIAGWRPPVLENNRDSDNETSHSNQEEETSDNECTLRLRGGWVDDEDLGSEGSTIAYETDAMEVASNAFSMGHFLAASEVEYLFEAAQNVRHPAGCSPAITNDCIESNASLIRCFTFPVSVPIVPPPRTSLVLHSLRFN